MSPHDRPTASELVEAVREWIERTLIGQEVEANVFHARVAANMLAIAQRELELGPEHTLAHRERLQQLGVVDDAELAAAIRSGGFDDRADELRDLVWASVRDKLAVANPQYLDRIERDDSGQAS